GQRQHCNDRESRTLAQYADGVAQVLQYGFKERQPTQVALLFLDLLDSTETEQRLATSFLRRQALAQVVLDHQAEMFLDLGVKFVLGARLSKQPQNAREECPHDYLELRASRRPMTPDIRSQFWVSEASCFLPARVME